MKARINSVQPKVAAGVNLSEEKSAVVAEVMAALGGEYRAAGTDCGNDSVGSICGLRGYTENSERAEVSAELLIFSGLQGNELNKAVTMLREKGCSIPLKAMVTPHNKDWTVSALAEELAGEHEYMTSRGKRDSNG
ncbi:DUF3783 domain-containing protein [Ruminococcus sp.]|uniref:DUF3783 domain-containing protein n=1 Tax=Ruminococcus sp. TaxID=41978 RepID=UPI0025E7CF93|nr:DUF3783 domain-containing protein [Ruminococcus sp.]MBQ8967889.1 DUF3783 domain-containing protein [Ruminococcus sp.]